MIRREVNLVLCAALLGLCFGLGVGAADMLPNDHGRTPQTATPLSGDSNTLTGVLEHDLDVDVFSFPFKPWTSYTLAVETGTVWGVRIEVIPPSGMGSIWRTNSVWDDQAAMEEAYHEGAAARWYLVVSPLFDFTTGTYHLAIWENPGQDTNDSGFPNAWEWHYFDDLDTADPVLHGDAFRTGRAPDDPFAVDSLQVNSNGHVVGWTTAAFGTYDLFTSTNLLYTNGWQYLGTHIAGSEGGLIHWTNAPSAEQSRFYRLRFRDE